MPAKVAKIRPGPMEPADLDGWSVDDMKSWAIPAARQLAEAEGRLDEARASVGLVLYRLRLDLGDGSYGETLSEILRETGVSARTLERWRRRAEEHFQLPPPSRRSVSQRATKRQGVSLREAETVPRSQPQDRPAPAAPTVDAPPALAAAPDPTLALVEPPAPIPQPSSREDYARLVALIITAGPAVLARSVDPEQLRVAARTIREALSMSNRAAPDRKPCRCKTPTKSLTVAGLCTACHGWFR